jgi:hypothetical protein
MGPDLLKVHEAISKSYEDDTQDSNPFNAVAASQMRLSEILNSSFVKFFIEAHFLKVGGMLIEKNILDKKGQKIFEEFQNSLAVPPDIIELLVNHTPEKEMDLFKKYDVPDEPSIDFSFIPEFFNYVGVHQDTLSEEDPKKISKELEERISKEITLPLRKLFGFLFNPLSRPKLISGSSIYPYNADKELGSGSVGDSFREGVHKEVLKQNSVSDYKQIPLKKYSADIIYLGYNAIDTDIFDHYKNAMQSFFLTPFYSHTVNINLHIPSPILPEGLIKEGVTLRKEISFLSNELIQENYTKKLVKSFNKILTVRRKILQKVSQIPISGNATIKKERKLHDLYPQIKSKHFPKSNFIKRSGKLREFNQKTLEESLSIFGQRMENSLHIDDIPTTLKMITLFSLSGKGIHGAEIESDRIIPRIKYIHKTQITQF